MQLRSLVPVLATGCWLALGSSVAAQDEKAGPSADDLAKTVQNPLATLISLPFQANYNLGFGESERTLFNLNIQPVIPYPGENWNIITRTIVPLNSIPIGEIDSVFGFGDTSLSIFFSPAKSSSVTWGVGPAITIPSASNPEVLGSGKLSLGPTGVIFVGLGHWTFGAVASNVWSIAGSSDREDVNFFLAQWFLNYNLGKGWAIGTAPIITGDWKAESGQRWVIPWGIQISKVSRIGRRPINVLVGYYGNSEHPDLGADKQVRFQLNFLFPQTKN